MNLTKLKELEDLKAEGKRLNNQIDTFRKAQKRSFLQQTMNDFKSFFKEKGFTVNSQQEHQSTAVYGTTTVILNTSGPDDSFFGAMAIHRLLIPSNSKDYTISVNEIGRKASITTTMSLDPKNDEERITKEIKDVQEQIQRSKETIARFDQSKLAYRYHDTAEGQRNPNIKVTDTPQFETLIDLLESIFK